MSNLPTLNDSGAATDPRPSSNPATKTPDYVHLGKAKHPRGTAVVQIGETLSGVARRCLGDASRWPEIYELNRDLITAGEVVLPGMVLKLPRTKPKHRLAPPPLVPVPRPKTPAEPSSDPSELRRVTPEQLADLGARDKQKFFDLLKPAALEAEQKYGVPWQVTLGQAALESGWGRHSIAGFNIFGIKGKGPAGSVMVKTQEWSGGGYVSEYARFAKYDDFFQAVEEHGKLFHNGHYSRAVQQFQADRDPVAFVRNIGRIYATSPTYTRNLLSIMREYQLV